MAKLRANWLQILVHILVLTPLVILIINFSQDNLTANPIQEIQSRTGRYTLILLVLTLACTPVYNIFKVQGALRVRRLLGLYTFFYASLHFLNFIGLDYRFNFGFIWDDIGTKRFILVSFPAFLILLALAVTSTKGWKNRLAGRWKLFQRLIYLAAILSVFHYIWLTKADFRLPLAFAGIVLFLLIIRLPKISNMVRVNLNRRKSQR